MVGTADTLEAASAADFMAAAVSMAVVGDSTGVAASTVEAVIAKAQA